MKKTIIAISIFAVAFGFIACSKDEYKAADNQEAKKVTVQACTESGPATRTALSGDDSNGYDVVWSAGDEIVIGDNTFALESGAGKTTASFTGTLPAEGNYTAWYATDGANWPAEQTYAADMITNSPMAAQAEVIGDEISPLEFKNLGGLLRLKLKGTATVKSITISANEAMAGAFTVSSDAAVVSGTTNSITLDCGTGVALVSDEYTTFCIAMPAGEYTDWKVVVLDTEGKSCVKAKAGTPLEITRSQFSTLKTTVSDFQPASLLWATDLSFTGFATFVKGVSGYNDCTSLVFQANYPTAMPAGAKTVSSDGAPAWGEADGTTLYIRTQGPCFACTNNSSKYLFNKLDHFTSIDLNNLNTENVTDMSYMFYSCKALTGIDLSPLNTDKVQTMSNMFYNCTSLASLDLSCLNTENVTDMQNMFTICSKLASINLKGINTSKVKDMQNMFNRSGVTNLDLSSFDTKAVTNMKAMFYYCSNLSSLKLGAGFNTESVTCMQSMFNNCKVTNLDLTSFNTEKVSDMGAMFQGAQITSLNLSSFNTNNVTSMSYMFGQGCNIGEIIAGDNFIIGDGCNTSGIFFNGTVSKIYNCPSATQTILTDAGFSGSFGTK